MRNKYSEPENYGSSLKEGLKAALKHTLTFVKAAVIEVVVNRENPYPDGKVV